MSAGVQPSSPGARLSIGEVVALLRPEFSDLTDSKIRFLEDRKLISPARTPGGYRSFGSHDIEVLRWILTRQRDQYLPLSIIGERIDRGEHLADIWGIGVTEPVELPAAAETAPESEEAGGHAAGLTGGRPADDGAVDPDAGDQDLDNQDLDNREPAVRAREPAEIPTPGGTGLPWAAEDDTRTYSAADLSAETGLTLDEIAELTDFGLLVPLADDDATRLTPPQPGATPSDPVQASLGLEPPELRYGSSALLIARISREFATYGLQARHLRVIRNAAARDASMFEQGIQPILHAGGASAELDALRSLGRLTALCERLRSVVMGEALRRYRQ
ncbi:MAG: MerR family DNA-binding transcriptional regulator [Acidimicrobiaceae bacterium]|nr:MerR family DNA-binding transcriptional regulator [Acidimicrobiaceae bacterium]